MIRRIKKQLSVLLIISIILTSSAGFGDIQYLENQSQDITISELGINPTIASTTSSAINVQENPYLLFQKYTYFNEMTTEEKKVICDLYHIGFETMDNPLLNEISMNSAIFIASFIEKYEVEPEWVLRIYKHFDSIEETQSALDSLDIFKSNYEFSKSDMDKIISLVIRGYDIEAASKAYFASKALSVDVENIIKEDFYFDISQIRNISDIKEGVNDNNLLDLYHISYKKLISLEGFEGRTAYSLYGEIDKYKESLSISSNQYSQFRSMQVATTQSDDGDDVEPMSYNKEYTAPFVYSKDQTMINSLTGGVISKTPTISLAGRNGLDLNIGAVYSSRDANLSEEDFKYSYSYQIVAIKYVVRVTALSYYYNWLNVKIPVTSEIPVATFTTYDKSEADKLLSTYNTTITDKGVAPEGYDLVTAYRATCSQESIIKIVENTENIINTETYAEKTNNLGAGWSWGFPSIETRGDVKYLHLSSGQIYQIKDNLVTGESNLQHYDLKDISLQLDASYTQTQTNKISKYVLKSKDGKQTYFSQDGTLLCVRDRFGNKVEWIYETSNTKTRLVKIIDSLGREILFSETNTSDTKCVTVTLPDQRKLSYKHGLVPGTKNDYLLKEYIDPLGRTTRYNYSTDSVAFSFFEKNGFSKINQFANLTSITYPTGSTEKITYSKVTENLSNRGAAERYRVQKREIIDTQGTNETFSYSYSKNNFTGYPEYSKSNDLPQGFVTSTTEKDGRGIARTDEYNNKLLNSKSTIVSTDGKVLKETIKTYNSLKLPQVISYKMRNPLSGKENISTEKFEFDSYGNILSKIDLLGNQTTYSYHSLNYFLPQKIQSFEGSILKSTVEYGVKSTTSKNIDWIKQTNIIGGIDKSITTELTYDSYGNTVKKLTRSGNETIDMSMEYGNAYQNAYLTKITTQNMTNVYNGKWTKASCPQIIQYEYNGKNGLLISVIDSKGIKTQTDYDTIGRITRITVAGVKKVEISYDDALNETIVKSAGGINAKYSYSGMGRIIQKTNLVTNSKLKTEYDKNGYCVAEIDALGYRTRYEYDDLGRLTKTINPDGSTRTTQYYDDTLSKINIDESGSQSYTQQDALGRLIKNGKIKDGKWIYRESTYDIQNKLVKSTDYNGNVTQYYYDQIGQLIECINSLGESTKYEYSLSGKPTKIITASGNTTSYEYDNIGQLLKMTNALGFTELYAYDLNGNLIYSKDKAGGISSYTFDSFNRKVKEQKSNQITVYQYDVDDHLIKIQDSSGAISQIFTPDGLLKKKIMPDGRYIEYDYDIRGQVVSIRDYFGNLTSYTYDMRGRLNKVITNNKATEYSYYPNSLLSQTTYPNGIIEKNTYENGLLTKRIYNHPNGTQINNFNYMYDENGNRITEGGPAGEKIYTYDALNRLKTVKTDNSTTVYSFDVDGNIVSKDEKGSDKLLTEVKTQYLYDKCNHLIRSQENTSYLNGTNWSLNASSNLSPLQRLQVGETVTITVSALRYDGVPLEMKYMGIGVTSGAESMKGMTFDCSQISSGVLKVKYNSLNTADHLSLMFDLHGKTKTVGIKLNSLNSGGNSGGGIGTNPPKDPPIYIMSTTTDDRSISIPIIQPSRPSVSSSVTHEFTYDSSGNLSSDIITNNGVSTTTTYQYDAYNKLISYKGENGQISTYTYYADGLRASKKVGNQVLGFYYQGTDIINETISGSLSARNVRGRGLIGRIQGSQFSTYLKDAHGDVIKIFDQNRNELSYYEYDAYGNGTKETGEVENPYRYTGQYLDEETGFYYLRARYYDSNTMRFTTEDSYLGDMKNPLSLNLYGYCMGNPVMYNDPTGHSAISIDKNPIIDLMIFAEVVSIRLMQMGSIFNTLSGNITEVNPVIIESTAISAQGITDSLAQSKDSIVDSTGNGNEDSVANVGEEASELRPESGYLKGKKHGLKWKEGAATAKSTGTPQGQWGSVEDLEFAAEKAGTLDPGEGAWFDLPEGSSSKVYMPDGTVVDATKIWVRNNGTGTFHGYPAP